MLISTLRNEEDDDNMTLTLFRWLFFGNTPEEKFCKKN